MRHCSLYDYNLLGGSIMTTHINTITGIERTEHGKMVFEEAMKYFENEYVKFVEPSILDINVSEYAHERYPEKPVQGFTKECMMFVSIDADLQFAAHNINVKDLLEQTIMVAIINKTTMKELLFDFADRLYNSIIDFKEANGTLAPAV